MGNYGLGGKQWGYLGSYGWNASGKVKHYSHRQKMLSCIFYTMNLDDGFNLRFYIYSIVVRAEFLATEGVEIESFSAPADRTGDLWYCVGVSSPLGNLDALKPLVKEAAQLTV